MLLGRCSIDGKGSSMSVKVRPFLRKGEERWEVDVRFNWPDGTIFRERKVAPGTSRSAAQKWGEARERELLEKGKEEVEKERRGNKEEPQPEAPTLDVFWERYVIDHCKGSGQSPSTIVSNTNSYKIYLKPHLGEVKLDEISDAKVDAFKARVQAKDKEKQLAPKTINNALSLLRHMLKTARRWKVIEAMPCEIIKRKVPKKEADFLTFEQFDALVAAAKKIDPRAHLFVLLGGRAGMRRGEIIALRWRNVDFARGVIKVVESDFKGELKPTKNSKGREVPMTPELRAALEAHRREGERVLLRSEGRPLDENVVRSWLFRAEKEAGLEDPKGKAHRLRHTLLSHLALRGAPLRTIQAIAGHHALSMTERYLHLSPTSATDAMQLLDANASTSGPPTPSSSSSNGAAGTEAPRKRRAGKKKRPALGDERGDSRGDEAPEAVKDELLVLDEEAPAVH